MIERRHGAFVCVSSTGGPFLAPYETLKAAQLGLANSLDAELADTGVTAFTIGPGLVPTPTAIAAIERVAPRLGMTVDEFWRTNHGAVLSVEAAGAGFAAAVAEAHRYAGQEISSTQALIDAGIEVPETQTAVPLAPAPQTNVKAAANACARVLATLREQSEGWKQRSFFERQWMLRDFKQHCGVPVERCLETLTSLESELKEGSTAHAGAAVPLLEKLARYYAHMGELAAGYFKDASQRQEKIAVIDRWVSEVQDLRGSLID